MLLTTVDKFMLSVLTEEKYSLRELLMDLSENTIWMLISRPLILLKSRKIILTTNPIKYVFKDGKTSRLMYVC